MLSTRGENVVAISRCAFTPGKRDVDGRSSSRCVPRVDGISAIFCFGPLQSLAAWLNSVELPLAPRVIVTSSMSAETKRESEVPAERAMSQLLRDSEQALAEACARHGSEWTVLRPTLVYGIGLDKSLTPIAQRAMRLRVFPLPNGRGVRQPVHAQDLASAALAALETPASSGKILPIGGGERCRWVRCLRECAAVCRWIRCRYRCPVVAARGASRRCEAARAAEPARFDLIADNTQVTQLLGVSPTTFSSGRGLLARTGVICPRKCCKMPARCHL
jgi:nucleoside-diphosphate-sugar epimerase